MVALAFRSQWISVFDERAINAGAKELRQRFKPMARMPERIHRWHAFGRDMMFGSNPEELEAPIDPREVTARVLQRVSRSPLRDGEFFAALVLGGFLVELFDGIRLDDVLVGADVGSVNRAIQAFKQQAEIMAACCRA